MKKKISENGIKMIKEFEGLKLKAYVCPGGKYTVGYGHTSGVTAQTKITASGAEALLKQDLARFETHVNSYDKRYSWTQNEFDALVSFAFNIGNIDQLTYNGRRSKTTIAKKMLEYVKADGEVLDGLVNRRQKERDLFLTKDVNAIPIKSLKVGAKVQIKNGAKDVNVNRKFANYVYKTTYTVLSCDSKYVCFGVTGKNGGVTGKVKRDDIIIL